MKYLFLIFLVSYNCFAEEMDTAETLSLPPEDKPAVEAASPALGTKSKNEVAPKKNKDNVGAILDFEGEVIEGERRRPDLFLQMSIDNVKFDSLIYNRDDFNDYLEVDRKSRNKFFKMK